MGIRKRIQKFLFIGQVSCGDLTRSHFPYTLIRFHTFILNLPILGHLLLQHLNFLADEVMKARLSFFHMLHVNICNETGTR